ncbi:GNAT family N-acetyltransferase [Cytobacillus purgationiresistens]|uniref:RimJ/RimL family protein N-acetyltransferase n=1 Tax=Cytobacillus purgationiresistens TaxID=863449 RepID=A0ABU0AAY4_9BACI|nr:GNAT family protein [Cytobacillus purgationiresistens]MDQ0268409.1 RimJ/RimL family protein N-acetyltransferase [Cytobacillus purgationiresistens]
MNRDFSLSGEVIDLLPLRQEHLIPLWKAGEPEEIWTYMATKIHTIAEMKTNILQAIDEREQGITIPFAVYHKELKKIVGSTRFLDISEKNNSAEIGSTWYHPSVWKSRVNTECKYLLLGHAFENWKMTRVFFKTDGRNIQSQTAIARLGAVKEGTLRKDKVITDGYVRDSVYYSVLQEEWSVVKANLERKLRIN